MPLIRLLVYSHLWISLGSVAFLWVGFLVFNTGWMVPPFGLLVFVFCSTFFTYNLSGILARRDIATTSVKRLWLDSARKWIGLGMVICLVGMIWGVWMMSWPLRAIFGVLGVVSLLYNMPEELLVNWLIPIRRIPFLKIFLIAYVWASLGVIIPAWLLDGVVWSNKLLLFFLVQFLYIIAITLPFDIRDLVRDKASDLLTIPGLIGERNSKILALACLLGFFTIGLFLDGYFTFVAGGMVLLTFPLVLLSHSKRHELFFTGIIDGLLIAYFPLICLVYGVS